MPSVRNAWQVRTLRHQSKSERKRQRLTDDVDLVEKEKEEDVEVKYVLVVYLQLLFTLCVAYARGGCIPRTAEVPESETTESTDYIEVPLEVMLRYHHRAETSAAELPPSQALEWLQKRDEDERTKWIERYRSSSLTFGQVVKEIYEKREAMWEVPKQDKPQRPATRAPPPPVPWVAPKHGSGAGGAGGSGKHGAGAAPQADGNQREICNKWNEGRCTEPCPAGRRHVCNAKLKNGKFCRLANHTAANCRNPMRR